MSCCILLLTHLLAFQGADLTVSAGKVYSSCKDSQYESNLMLGVCGDFLFKDNLAGRLEYSHIWLRSETPWGSESENSDEIFGILRLTKRVFDFADVYAFGGGGFWMNPLHEPKFSACYGIGTQKTISSSVFLELNFRIHRVIDEATSLRDWQSFYGGLGIHLSKEIPPPVVTTEDEVEIIFRYLAPDLKRSKDFESDEEMHRFVKEFWKANDPIPHTPENEFKEDVFSRIDYANRWFRETKEGWKTDRGRIWIIWGEPDEIVREDWASHPIERWVYFETYKDIMPVVFVFQQYVAVYRQVFSNIPGEFGHRVDQPD